MSMPTSLKDLFDCSFYQALALSKNHPMCNYKFHVVLGIHGAIPQKKITASEIT
ncbi:MAG: hypothetical protein KAS22_13950 [Candidatus Heimdallarchaeota archaeon]|nr:hypothetical protein [Candidatus Heimdallarchaeota archaeon]